jgi:hypothetical protein
MRAFGIAVAAAVIAFAPLAVLAGPPGVAGAAPCAGAGSNPGRCSYCRFLVGAYHTPSTQVCDNDNPPRPVAPATTTLPQVAPPPWVPTVEPPVPPGSVPATKGVMQTPKINPPSPGSSKATSVVPPPKHVDAPPQAVAAAKAAAAARIDPASPPALPSQVNFDHLIEAATDGHASNVEIVRVNNQAFSRPRVWEFVDYDAFHRPILYNPLTQAMTFRYFYNFDYRDLYVPAGGRVILDASTVGLVPFTAVGDNMLAAGSFTGGAWIPPPDHPDGPPPPDYVAPAPPAVYQDVSVYVPNDNQIVEVGRVQVVGHDDNQSVGNQDMFLLDNSTVAWGQANDATSGAQIRVTRTQSLPGVGPTDNGGFLVELATHPEPIQPAPAAKPESLWPALLRFGLLAAVVGAVLWFINRRRQSGDAADESATESRHLHS